MMGRQYFFVITLVIFANCNGLGSHIIGRRVNFNLNMEKNIEILKEAGVYEDLGSKLVSVYSMMETHANEIYEHAEKTVNNAVHLYNEFQKNFVDLQEMIERFFAYDHPTWQQDMMNERFQQYERLIESRALEKDKPMLKTLMQQNYKLADKIYKMMTKNLNEVNKLNLTIITVQKNVPSEEQIMNIIKSKLESFENIMKTGRNMFMKSTQTIVEDIGKTIDLGVDHKTVLQVGSLKLYSFNETIKFRCAEFIRKINKMDRAMMDKYNYGVDFVEKMREKEKNFFIDFVVNTAINEALIEKNFKVIDDNINMPYSSTGSPQNVIVMQGTASRN